MLAKAKRKNAAVAWSMCGQTCVCVYRAPLVDQCVRVRVCFSARPIATHVVCVRAHLGRRSGNHGHVVHLLFFFSSLFLCPMEHSSTVCVT